MSVPGSTTSAVSSEEVGSEVVLVARRPQRAVILGVRCEKCPWQWGGDIGNIQAAHQAAQLHAATCGSEKVIVESAQAVIYGKVNSR